MKRIMHRRITGTAIQGVGGESPLFDLLAATPWWGWCIMGGGAVAGWYLTPATAHIIGFSAASSNSFVRPFGAMYGAFLGFIGMFLVAFNSSAEM